MDLQSEAVAVSIVYEYFQRLTYKPGVKFRVMQGDGTGRVRINMSIDVYDVRKVPADADAEDLARTPKDRINFTHYFSASLLIRCNGKTEELLDRLVYEMIMEWEEHEAREWLRKDGVHVREVHPEEKQARIKRPTPEEKYQ